MATREEAGKFALVTWRALLEDLKRCWPESDYDWSRLEAWIDDLADSDPAWMFVNALVLLPKLGKWFDRCISEETFRIKLPEEWGSFPFSVYNSEETDNAGIYLPVIAELFPNWSLRPSDPGFPVFPLDPNRIMMVRQFLYMHKKFTVQWKEGSDVQVASEFWFCGCGTSAIAFNSGFRESSCPSQWTFQGRLESIGLMHSEEDCERS